MMPGWIKGNEGGDGTGQGLGVKALGVGGMDVYWTGRGCLGKDSQ